MWSRLNFDQYMFYIQMNYTFQFGHVFRNVLILFQYFILQNIKPCQNLHLKFYTSLQI